MGDVVQYGGQRDGHLAGYIYATLDTVFDAGLTFGFTRRMLQQGALATSIRGILLGPLFPPSLRTSKFGLWERVHEL